jgi:hypothetical protein
MLAAPQEERGMTDSGSDQGPRRDTADELQARMQAFGREAQAAGERLGRDAQAAGERMAQDPGWIAFGTWVGRLWGLVLIAIGLWFLAGVTLGMDLPTFDWQLIWPVALIAIGGLFVLTALVRRR